MGDALFPQQQSNQFSRAQMLGVYSATGMKEVLQLSGAKGLAGLFFEYPAFFVANSQLPSSEITSAAVGSDQNTFSSLTSAATKQALRSSLSQGGVGESTGGSSRNSNSSDQSNWSSSNLGSSSNIVGERIRDNALLPWDKRENTRGVVLQVTKKNQMNNNAQRNEEGLFFMLSEQEGKGTLVTGGSRMKSSDMEVEEEEEESCLRESAEEEIARKRSVLLPFSQSCMMNSVQLGERNWRYIDELGEVQGPFTSIEMDNWYLKDFFELSLKVAFRNMHKSLFFALEKLLSPPKRTNHEVKQFLETEKPNFTKRSRSSGDRSGASVISKKSAFMQEFSPKSSRFPAILGQEEINWIEGGFTHLQEQVKSAQEVDEEEEQEKTEKQLEKLKNVGGTVEAQEMSLFSKNIEGIPCERLKVKKYEGIREYDAENDCEYCYEGDNDDADGDENIAQILNCIGLGDDSD